ncbi:hypothetical protein DICPUDRAFT_152560 [Dictyostelium purpureum]|uniref:Thiamin pyrophosphokinase thiamin-binding domain-containing protein n=1 Tax=Dictyostelium purpureum TaxID=5786 RepID=F0ZLP4_DICPU|nr:uncharacterized protein DICPUDRAFT_152560 [Dictyostelium purpureum]EGC35149.1 hypothetical protein DICPUDRAFT_152560 [Dictyostelium purpureum]|eukprot:XP_003288342.1 hypothetical protein DICPUDRAFT_152560 [Dictyostelium purpureum]
MQQESTHVTPLIHDEELNKKEILNWDVYSYGGYLFQEKREVIQTSSRKQRQQPLSSSSASASSDEEVQSVSSASSTPRLKTNSSSSSLSFKRVHSYDDMCALVIANQKLNKKMVEFFWDKCSVKICADGGANRLYSLGTKLNHVNKWVPDYIKGDLDSLHEGVSDYYAKKGSSIVLDSSQDTSDLQKCFELIVDIEKNSGIKYRKIIILGGLGGSFSHEFANVNTLFDHPERKIILTSKENIAWLLNPSYKHSIDCQVETKCSLIPLASKVSEVSTTGLKWNLVNQSLNFGDLISTSNVSIDTRIVVDTSNPLLFIVDINP